MSAEAQNAVEAAIIGRRSVRAFHDKPVPQATVAHLLNVAASAPSGSNTQPWRVHVLSGPALDRLKNDLLSAFLSGDAEQAEYAYYPRVWRSPYIERRRAAGWGLYELAGVARGDREGGVRQRARNYQFFDAPVGLIFLIDRDLEQGSWLDLGMFIQNVMVAARGIGLDSCAQQAIANYPRIIGAHVPVRDEEMVVCGMALGYADLAAPVNRLRTSREPSTAFCAFHHD